MDLKESREGWVQEDLKGGKGIEKCCNYMYQHVKTKNKD